MNKILVVAESIDIDTTSGAKANAALINALISCEYEVTILHYSRNVIDIPLAICIEIKEDKRSVNYVLSRMQRVFQRLTKINISKPLERVFGHSFTFFNDSSSMQKAILKYYDNQHLIITLSQAASFRPHHAMLKFPKLYNIWLAYVHDPYPFHYYPKPYNWVEAGYIKKEAFLKRVSESARYSAFPSLLLKEWVGQFFPKFLESGIIIPHQNSKFSIQKNRELNYFDSGKFTLLHAGSLFMPRSPIGLIEGFKLFLEANPGAISKVNLLMLGDSSYYKQTLSDYNVDIDELYVSEGYVSFNDVYALQHKVSVNIILEAESDVSPFLPGKFPHCIEANKPILLLGPKLSESRRLLGEDYPYHSTIHDSKRIAILIEELYVIWSNNKNDLKLDRKDIENYLSSKNLGTILKTLK